MSDGMDPKLAREVVQHCARSCPNCGTALMVGVNPPIPSEEIQQLWTRIMDLAGDCLIVVAIEDAEESLREGKSVPMRGHS